MARTWLHRVLEHPGVYRLSQHVLAPGSREIHRVYGEVYGSVRGRVLDVGCGPRPDTPLPEGTIVGLDVNHAYVQDYCRPRDGERTDCAKLGIVGSAATMPFADESFDECRSAAVLHHLPEALARDALREMCRAVRRGGRVAIFDMIWPRSFVSAPLAWMICRFDRGAWVRTEEELIRLARDSYDGAWQTRRFSFSWTRLCGMVLTLRKQ